MQPTMPQRHDAPDDCHGCDRGWIEDESGAVTPCPSHLPTQHARWAAGQYRPTPWDWFVEQRAA